LGEGFVPQAFIELWISRSHVGKTVLVHKVVPALINTSCMRFSTVEQPDLQQLQMKCLQQQQPTGLVNFNYHRAAAEGGTTAASVIAPAPRFSHSILLQQQQHEDFKRPQLSLQQLMQQHDHHRHHHHHRPSSSSAGSGCKLL
jgi:hypothetical protein